MKKSFSQPILSSTSSNNYNYNSLIDHNSTPKSSLCCKSYYFGFQSVTETMRKRSRGGLFVFITCLFIFASFSLFLSRTNSPDINDLPPNLTAKPRLDHHHTRHVASIDHQDFTDTSNGNTVAILMPDWEVLVVVQPDTSSLLNPMRKNYTCFYPNKHASIARFAGVLPSSNQSTFKCTLPERLRVRLPFPSPVLTAAGKPPLSATVPNLLRWTYLVYDSISTQDDVVLLVKGLNHHQGVNRLSHEFRCVFFYYNNSQIINTVKTTVTSSVQEVFRCQHPDLTDDTIDVKPIRVSLEITQENKVVPSVAYYNTMPFSKNQRKMANNRPHQQKSLVCACTMVFNVGKFLREWVLYHSKIGVEKFILYDNDSDDDLASEVDALRREGYNIETMFWIWPKTQEAGFSHAALYGKSSCTWMMYIDVDEFLFSPAWLKASEPSDDMIRSLLPSNGDKNVGQISMMCNDFGPSDRGSHPVEGVTQGYDCRRRVEQRHKSLVLLEAVGHSLVNIVHHFVVNQSLYEWTFVNADVAVVNHYKYQAWSEFKTKFRRRVSAFVVDWQSSVNPSSQDRTPGLGSQAIQPKGWAQMFCEIRDERLKTLTRQWFGIKTSTGHQMAWQKGIPMK